MKYETKCIICNENPNATGSHIVPASLIKNCVGKHYAEESYEIDAQNAQVNIYFGRDNLKNTDTEIKKHHYKENNILCKNCEDKLADLEALFFTQFLSKFRIEKFKANFDYSVSDKQFEIFEPKKLSNNQIQAYIYSIILRYCRDNEFRDGTKFLEENELIKIKEFVNGFLYEPNSNYINAISNFNIILTFDKYDDKGSFVCSSNQFNSPYLFYFCEVIVKLYTSKVPEEAKELFGETINNINQETSKIIVGPTEYYTTLKQKMSKLLADEFVINGINYLCSLNGKSIESNSNEFKNLFLIYQKNGIVNSTAGVLDELRKKYGG